MSATAIAKLIGVSKSTVSREIKRNLNMYRHYVWIDAQQFSDMRRHIPRRTRRMTKGLWGEIVPLLKRHWSPETIVGVIRRNGRDCVSVEWIYHLIRQDKERGGSLYTYLPHHLKHRRRPVSSRIPIKDRVSIDERPAVVEATETSWTADNVLTVKFDRGMGNAFHQVYLFVYTPDLPSPYKYAKGFLASPVYRRDKRVSVALPDVFAGHTAHLYLMVQTDDGRWSETSYAGSLMLTEMTENIDVTDWELQAIEAPQNTVAPNAMGTTVDPSSLPSPSPASRRREDKG